MKKEARLELEYEIKERTHHIAALVYEKNKYSDEDLKHQLAKHIINETKKLRELRRIRDSRNDENDN